MTESATTDYTVTIGLEVHAQLKTRSKMFCGCKVEYGAEPNTHTCPTCFSFLQRSKVWILT